MRRFGACVALLLLALALLPGAGSAMAAGGRTLQAGPYVVQVSLSQDRPQVGQAFAITVVSVDALSLTGQMVAQPLAGTDATPIRASLAPEQGHVGTLVGSVSLSVHGYWRLILELNGPRGPGSAHVDVLADLPYVMPAWVGWMIGLIPLAIFIWWLWRQGRYRSRLLAGKSREQAGSSA